MRVYNMSCILNKCLHGERGGRGQGEKVLKSLLNAIKERTEPESHASLDMMDSNQRSVFFVGAGASIESGLPNFRQFSEHMLLNLLSLDHGVTNADISMFVSELRPEVLLQSLHEVFGDKIFEFYDWFDGAQPSTNHYILARVLREGGMVLTTNVDVLIEAAYEEMYGEKDFDLLVTKDHFEEFSVQDNPSKGALIKFHGTVDLTKTGLAKYDTVRFLLDQVGEGMGSGMHQVLREICETYDVVYLGYSGCDNFSVQPVLCHTKSDQTILWMWFEWKEKMDLENSREIYQNDMNEVGNLVSQGKSFNEINRGMETLSTCEILSERQNALRLRGKVSEIMHACALPDEGIDVEGVDSNGPIPEWTKSISAVDRLRCAARLYSKANSTDEGIKYLEKADSLASKKNDKFLKAKMQSELGNEYAKASTSEYYKKALICYDKALKLFDALGNNYKVMDTKLDTVNVLRRTRRFNDAENLLEEIDTDDDSDPSILKLRIRKGLMKGLILGMGRRDKESRDAAVLILEEVANLEAGFVGLQAAVLNASGLIKYQMAGNSVEILQSGAKDLEAAFRLNIYVGDARSCFQQMRNIGLIHAKLSRLLDAPELLEQAIEEFKRGEKFLFRLSRNRIMGELLEIRFRLGESLAAAERVDEARPILSNVREERVKLDDWHNEARTLELLVKCAVDDEAELLTRVRQIQDIYEDAVTNKAKRERFTKVPITAANGKQILQTASNLVMKVEPELSTELQKLSNKLFPDK